MKATINIDGIDLEVEYTYYRATRGARDSLGGVRGAGPPLEPDEPESIEIEQVIHKGDDILDFLSETLVEKIELELLENTNQDCYEDYGYDEER